LFVELPFWLMTPSYTFDVEVEGCTYALDVIDYFAELFGGDVTDSRRTSLYIGPQEYEKVHREIRDELEQQQIAAVWRPCKSVVRIPREPTATCSTRPRTQKLRRQGPAKRSTTYRLFARRTSQFSTVSSRAIGFIPTTSSLTK